VLRRSPLDELNRSVDLFKAFRTEKTDPDRFYRLLAEDSVEQVARHHGLEGSLVLDVGGGEGYFTRCFQKAGSRCILVEPELTISSAPPTAIVGDGFHLPFDDSTADICFSSNVLEHVSEPERFIGEMARVTKPGGIIYAAFTNWYSPWGGHGTSPWHYFGGEWALERFTRTKGHPPNNRYGENLFEVHVSQMFQWAQQWPGVELVEAAPRYYPAWLGWLVKLPGIREVATWNLMLIMRRTAT
jgi:SAM-dependent methyltransferase